MKLIEKYAFITNENHLLHVTDKWPDAISVGDNYKMVQFTDKDEPDLIDYIESLGFTAKYINGLEVIAEMESGYLGPFICDHKEASMVVQHFNKDSGEIT